MLKNVTITVPEEILTWARVEAAKKNSSVSKLVCEMLEREQRRTGDYWKAYEKWKKIKPIPGFDASRRLTREEANDRRSGVRRHERPAV